MGVGVWGAAEHTRTSRIVATLLLLYAVSSFVGGTFLNMDMRGTVPTPRGGMHPLATAVMSAFILLTVAIGATLHGKKFWAYSMLTLATMIVFGVLVSLQAPKLAANEPTPFYWSPGARQHLRLDAVGSRVCHLPVALPTLERSITLMDKRIAVASAPLRWPPHWVWHSLAVLSHKPSPFADPT